MEIKAFRFGEIKAGPQDGLKEGEMLAYASIFGNVDSYGDVVVKGAFDRTLKAWKSSDRVLPLLYLHNMSDPSMNIGEITEASEDEKGLKIKTLFDLDEDSPVARKVYKLVKGKRINELSFAYDVVKSNLVQDKDRPGVSRELLDMDLHECSVVPIGANPDTEVIAVKSAVESMVRGIKAGRTLSAANEKTLRAAHESIVSAADALATVLPSGTDDADGDPAKSGPTLGEKDLEALATLVAKLLGTDPPSKSTPARPDPLVALVESWTLPTV